MFNLSFDKSGKVHGLPDAIPPADTITVEIVGRDVDISDADDSELVLALEKPLPIINGLFTVTFGASSFSIPAGDVSAYSIGSGLNRMDSVVSAGGITSSGADGLVTVAFDDVGTTDAITFTHSYLGSMTGRCRTIRAGSVSAKALYELDFTVQTLAKSTSATDIAAADITIANVATGDVSTAQRDTITLSRIPEYGKLQIWTAEDLATSWLLPTASSYQIEMALEDIDPGAFIVSRHENAGGAVIIDLLRAAEGANDPPTVSDTFIGPVGVTLDLDLSLVGDLLRAVGLDSQIARLSYTHEGEMKFSELVKVAPSILVQPQPI